MDEDVLAGSPQSSQMDKSALRERLSEKRHLQQAALAQQAQSEDEMLSALNGLEQGAETARLSAHTHRQVSLMVHEHMKDSQAQMDSTLRASRLLHEKVAQRLESKAMRRRAQRDVLKRWTVSATGLQHKTRAQRMSICCGCSTAHKHQRVLSDRPMAEAATMFQRSNWAEALKAYDHALLMMGQSETARQAEAHLVRCECLLRLRDYATMEYEADALLRTAGDNWAGYRMRGTARFYLGNLKGACDDYALALQNLSPSDGVGSFAGPCTEETKAALVADRDELIRQTGDQGAGCNSGAGNHQSTSIERRTATEIRIGTG